MKLLVGFFLFRCTHTQKITAYENEFTVKNVQKKDKSLKFIRINSSGSQSGKIRDENTFFYQRKKNRT